MWFTQFDLGASEGSDIRSSYKQAMQSVSRHPATINPLAATLQSALLLLTLLAAIAWPRAGQAALLLPLKQSWSGQALAWLQANDAAVLGQARVGSGMVLRLARDDTAFAALKQGWLLIAVPEAACISETANSSRT